MPIKTKAPKTPRPKTAPRANRPGPRYFELVRAHPLLAIDSEEANDAAVAVLHSLAGDLSRDVCEYRNALARLVWAFEEVHYPMGQTSDPAGMLRFLMEARNASLSEVAGGSGLPRSTLSEVASGKRGASARVRRALAEFFRVDPGLFA